MGDIEEIRIHSEYLQKIEALETELAAAQERIAYLERTDTEAVDEFNAGYSAAERGEPNNEPTGTKHDEWRVGYAFAMYPALLERIQQLEASREWEPDWNTAPEWAQWWAIDENGSAFWYSDQPTLWRNVGEWNRSGGDYLEDTSKSRPDWVSTLSRRPQETEQP